MKKTLLLSLFAVLATVASFAATYYSQGSVIMTTLGNWNTVRTGGGATPGNFTTSGDVFVVQGAIASGGGGAANHSMFTSGSSLTFGANVKLWLEGGSTVTTANAITINATGTFQMDNNSTYIHNHGGAISALFNGVEVIGATSNFNVTATSSITSTAIVSAPGLGNFTYSGSGTMQCNGAFPNLQGNLTVSSAILRFNSSAASGITAVTINGDLNITGSGRLEWGNGSVVGYTVNLKGNLTISSTDATPILFAGTGAAGSTVSAYLNFTNTVPQIFTISSATASLIVASTVAGSSPNFYSRQFTITVNSGAIVNIGTSILNTASTSTVNFVLSNGAGLITANANGISSGNTASGSIQNLAGARTFNTGSNYTYNSSLSSQITGTGLPTTVNNLTINNAFTTPTVTLTNAPTLQVNGSLNLTNGILTTGSNVVLIPSGVSVNRSAGWVNGNLRKWIDAGVIAVTYEIGDATVYAPLLLDFKGTGVATPGYVTATTGVANTSTYNYSGSGMSTSKYVTRYWQVDNTGGITFDTYDVTATYDAADIAGGGTPTSFVIGRYDLGNNNWTFPTASGAAYYVTGVGINTLGTTGSSGFMAGELATSGITTGSISPLTYCAGASISVPYTKLGTFNAGNVFTAQLSDATGVFSATPPTLGTLTSTASGTISGTIPSSTVSGTGYRVRVVGSNPATTGSNNGTDITVQNPAVTFVATADSVCFNAGAQTAGLPYSALTDATNYSISGWSGGGFANVPSTAIPASPIPVSVPAGVAIGTYTATLTVNNGTCTGNSYTITIKVVSTPTLLTVAQSGSACANSTATINLTGLVASSLGNTVVYKIGSGSNQSVTGVNADAGGNATFTVPVVLTDNGQTFTVVSITNGCTVTFNMAAASTLSVLALPTITFTTGAGTVGNPAIAAAVCAGTTSTTLSYTATSGSPTTYSISGWSGGGFANVTNAVLPASPINITVPAGAAANVYTATLTVSNGTCSSSNYTISVTVNALPGFTVTSNPINVLQGTTPGNLTYNTVVGSPDTYSISGWSGGGFANVPALTALPGSPIAIAVPTAPAPAVGTYTANLVLASSTTGCSSGNIVITVNIYTPKTYYSQGSVSVNTLTNWNTFPGGGGATPANFTSGDIFVIQNAHSMTTASAWAISGSGSELQIQNGGTLTATFIVSVPTFTINNGGTYVHNAASGASAGVATDIPGTTRNFGASSTVEIQKWANGGAGPVALPISTTISGGLGWGNLKINVASLGGSWQQSGALTKVQGNLEIAQTGTGTNEFRLANGAAYTLDISGNLIVSGGILVGDNGAGTYTIHTVGNATFSGGTFKFANNNSALPTLNFDGNFNISGGTLDNAVSSSTCTTFFINVGTNMNVSAGSLILGNQGTKSGNIVLTGGDAIFTGTGIVIRQNTVLNLSVVGNISIGDALGGTSGIQMSLAGTSSSNMSVSCTGNFTLTGSGATGGLFEMQSSSSSGKSYTLTIGGNYNQTGGTFTGGSSSSPANIYFQNGTASVNYTQSGGTITSSSVKNNYFVTNGKTVTLLNSINVLSGSTFTIDGGGILVCGSSDLNNALTGSGGFTLSTNGKLITANAAGIRGSGGTTGSIRTIGTNDFKSDATIEFNSSVAAQTMGFANITMSVANNIDNIIINNTFSTPTVTLDANMTVNAALTLTAGKVLLGNNNLTISATGTISGATSTKYIVTNGTGFLKRPSTGAAVSYPVGPTTVLYNPVSITNAGTADNYSVRVASGAPANLPTASTNYVQDTWTIAEDLAGGSDLTVVPQWALTDEGSTFVRTGSVYVGRYITGTNWETNTAVVAGSNPYTGTASGFNTVGTTGVAFVVGTFPPPPTVTLNQISAIGASSVTQGSVNNIIYNFSLTVSAAGNIVVDEVRIPTTGSSFVAADMANFQLWFNTANNGPGAGATSIKTITGPATGTQTFSLLSQGINLSTTGYFWVTADISGCATIGNTIQISPKLATSNITLLTSGTLVDGGTTNVGGTKTISAGTSSITLAPISTVAAANIGQGSANNIIYNFSVTSSGTANTITQVVVPVVMTSAADFTNLQLWYNATSNNFADIATTSIKSIAPAGGGTETFASLTSNPAFACGAATTGYFWVTADVAAGATLNNTIRANPAIAFSNITFSAAASSASTTTVAGGLQTIVIPTLSNYWFRSVATGDWTTLAVWESAPGAGGPWNTATLYPTSTSPNVAIRNTDVITVSTAGITPGLATSVASGAKLVLSGSGTFNATGTVVTVNGTVENAVAGASPFTSTSSEIIFTGTGVFNLTSIGTVPSPTTNANVQIPTATWNTGSTCKITGLVGTAGDFNNLLGVRQTFYHFVVDMPSFTGNLVLAFNSSNTAPKLAVAGDFTVNSTGTGTLQLTSSSNQTDITVSGNYIQNGTSNVNIVRGTNNNVSRYFRVLGNFTMNGTSSFNLVGATGGTASNTGTLEVGGNLTMASTATLTKTSSGGTASIGTLNFTGTSAQSAVFGIVTNVNTSATGTFNITVTGAGGVTLNSDLVAPGNLSLINGDFTVPITRTLTLSPNATNTPGGSTLRIDLGRTFTINGTVLNQGTFLTPGSWAPLSTFGNWVVNNGGTYIHNTTGGIAGPLTTSTLTASSNFIYRGGVPTAGLIPAISISGKTYGNLTFESYSGLVSMPGGLGSSGAGTLTINGNLSFGGTAGLGTVSYTLQPSYTGDVIVAGNIGIVSSNTFIANSNNISLKGNWSNAGAFTAGTSTVIFNSSTAAQTLSQTGTGDFYSLTNSNTSGTPTVTLNNNAAVQAALTLSGSSVLQLSNSNLTLRSTATRTANVSPVTTAATIAYGGSGLVIVERYVDALRSWRLMTAPISTAQTIKSAWMEGSTNVTTGVALAAAILPPYDMVDGYGTHISGPSPAANGFDETPLNNYSIKYYDKAAATKNWVGDGTAPVTPAVDIRREQGWMLFIRGNRNYNILTSVIPYGSLSTTLRTTGRINIGNMPSINTSTGFTVVGNPYASAVNFSDVTKTFPGGGSDKFYVWDPKIGSGTSGQSVGGWVVMTRASGTSYTAVPTPASSTIDLTTGRIESGQAIVINAANISSVTFEETDKSALNALIFRPAGNNNNKSESSLRTNLYAKNSDGSKIIVDGVMNIFAKGNNTHVDGGDALKFTNVAENFSLLVDGTKLSIDERDLLKENDTIFYDFGQVKVRDYIMELDAKRFAKNNLVGYLEDRFLNTKTRIKSNGITSIEFNANRENPGSYAKDRFRIVFKKAVKYNIVKADVISSDVLVEWNVADEFDINKYEVERSADGENFSSIATRLSDKMQGAGYSQLDEKLPAGEYYYRIKTITNLDMEVYSEVVKVKVIRASSLPYVFPNPVTTGTIHLQLTSAPAGKYNTRLLNAAGQLMNSQVIAHAGGTATKTITPAQTLTAGTYQLEVISPDKTKSVIKVMVNNK